jgi:hypothetical protein
MPTPVLITGGAGLAQFGNPGPIAIGGALYAVLNGISTFQIWKSTDAGNTWNEIDIVGEPTGTISAAWASCTDGTNIFVASFTSGFVLEYIPFDTATQLWGAPVSTGNTCIAVQQVAYRSFDNSLIVCGIVSAGTPGLSYCVITIGGSTTAFTHCSNNPSGFYMTSWGILQGHGSDFWFLFNQTPIAAGTQFLQIQKIDNTNTLGSVVNVDSGPAPGGASLYASLISGFSDGTTFALVWQPDHTVQSVNVLDAPTLTMSFTTTALPCPAATTLGQVSIVLSTGIGGLLVEMSLNGNEMVFTVNTGGGFGPFTTLISAVPFVGTKNFSSIIDPSFSGGWAMLFTGAGGVNFLAGSAPTTPAAIGIYGPVGVVALPTSGTLCRFAEPKRCVKQPYRTILSSNLLVYGVKK